MPFQYLSLPFDSNALEPFISEKTMNFHHEKHYKKYVDNLNELTSKSPALIGTLEETMMKNHKFDDAVFQNAAQVWNHEFFWKCLSPNKPKPTDNTLETLREQFGSVQKFTEDFNHAGVSLFGSGWVWVVMNPSGDIEIQALDKAENPMTSGQIPLLVCDIWEHAYYLDYQNDRSKYLKQFWQIVNWKFFEQNLQDSGLRKSRPMQSEH